MPTLEEISERAAEACERLVQESQAMDYAWLGDLRAIRRGERPSRLDDLIDRKYRELIGVNDGDGSTGTEAGGIDGGGI